MSCPCCPNAREARAIQIEDFDCDDMLDAWVRDGDAEAFAVRFLARLPEALKEALVSELL